MLYANITDDLSLLEEQMKKLEDKAMGTVAGAKRETRYTKDETFVSDEGPGRTVLEKGSNLAETEPALLGSMFPSFHRAMR